MNTKTILALAAALSLLATPAMTQSRTQAKPQTKTQVETRASKKAQATAPGVHVSGKPAAFAASRSKLGASGTASLQALSAARKAKGKALGSRVDVLYIKIGDIKGESAKLGRSLKGGPKAGKTKTARDLVAKIESRATSARTHAVAAKKAFAKNDAAATQRALDAAEVDVRAIDALSGELALLEPIMSR